MILPNEWENCGRFSGWEHPANVEVEYEEKNKKPLVKRRRAWARERRQGERSGFR